MPIIPGMECVPFATVARGLRHDHVAEMLQRQMEIARTDPVAALELLDKADMGFSEPGVDPGEVHGWMEQQRIWLHSRVPAPPGVDVAVSALESAMNDLRIALADEARSAEQRAAAVIEEAEHRAAQMMADAERRIDELIDRARRKMRKEARRIHSQARADADRLLQSAGGRAAELLFEAEEERRVAAEATAEAHALQESLVLGIDAARRSMRGIAA